MFELHLDRFDPVPQVDIVLSDVTRLRRDYESLQAGGSGMTVLRRESERLMSENTTLRKSNEEFHE